MKHAGAAILLAAVAATGLSFAHPFGDPRVEPRKGLDTLLQAANAQTSANLTGDAARGKAVFQKRCTGCHALETDLEGPRLAGVFGRKAGTIPGFDYSTALKNSGITWDDAKLEKWLSDPDMLVPGNNMGFYVPKAQERLDLIAYLKQ